MPNSVDNKIVEMQFDNANFEKNVKQSIKTLEALNKALDLEDAAKGFEQMEQAANSIDLSKLMKAADVIEKRFSAAGIAGAALIQRGVNGAINMIGKLGNKVVSLAKTGGINRALNLEHANFMLEGILKDAGKVADIMNGPVNDAVSGTAYGLDSAAKAAGQFVASGITDLEKLRVALTGISGVAAMSGSSYDEIARIFNKVAARGKVMGDTIQELSTRGIAAQEELAKHLKVTVAEVQDMQKKGKISFEAFSEAMYDAFAEQAKKANETFTGAMSNVRAALSRIGAKIATPAIENLRKIFVSLIDVINKVNTLLSGSIIKRIVNFMNEVTKSFTHILNSGKFLDYVESLVNTVEKSFSAIAIVVRAIKNAFKAIVPKDALTRMTDFNNTLGSLLDKLILTEENAANLQLTFQGLFAVFDTVFTLIKQLLGVLMPGINGIYNATDSLSTKILKLTGFIGYVLTRLNAWIKQNNIFKKGIDLVTNALKSLTSETSIFSKVIQGIGLVIGGIIYVFYLIGSAIATFLKKAYELPIVQTIVNDIKNAIVRLGDMAVPIIGFLAAAFDSLLESLENFAKGQYLTTGLEKLNDVLNNAYWGVKNFGAAIGSFFNIFKKGDDAVEKMEKVTVATEKLYGSAEAMTGTTNVVVRNVDGINTAVTTLADTAEEAANTTSGAMMSLDKAGHIFAIGFGASVISAGVNIGRGFREIGKVARNLKSTTKSISLFFNQLQLNLRIKTLMALAGTIVIFAGALALLTQLDPGRLALAALIIGSLVAALTFLGKGLAKTDSLSIKRFQTASKGIFELAGAVLVLALSAKLLSNAVGSWKQLGSMIAGMIATVVLMGALAKAVVFIGNKQLKAIAGASAMLAIASSVYIVMASLQKIADLDYDRIYKALPLVLSILGGMAAIAVAMTFVISPFGGLSFMGIVAGVLLLMEGLQLLQSVDAKVILQAQMIIDQIVTGITHIIGALIVLQALKTAESVFNWLPWIGAKMSNGLKGMFAVLQKGIKYIGVAAVIIAIGVSIKLIGDTLISLGAMWEQDKAAIIAGVGFVAGTASLILVMTEHLSTLLSATLEASQYAKAVGPALLGVAAIMLTFVAAVAIFGNMDPQVVGVGLFMTVMLEILILGFIALLALIQKEVGPLIEGSMKTLIGLSILIGVLVATVAVLGIIPADDAWRGVGMLALLMGALMGVLAAMSLMKDMTVSATVAVYGLIGVFIALSFTMNVLEGINTGQAFANLIVLEVAVAAMAGIIFLLSDDKINFKKGLLVVIGITAVIAVLAKVATVLEKVNPERLKSSFIVLGEALGVLAVAMGVLGGLASIGGGAGAGVMGAGLAFLAALAGVLLLVASAAVKFGAAAQMIGEGLTKIAYAIKEIEHADFENVNTGLKELKEALSGIGQISGYINQSADALLRLAPAISSFGNSMLLMTGSITAFNNIDLSNIMVNLIRLGEAIQFVNDRALQFGEFSIIAIAVGASCGVLGAGLMAATTGMIGFAFAVDMVCGGIAAIVFAFEQLGNIVLKIVDSMNNFITSISKMGANTVNEIYKTLVEYASSELYNAGNEMMVYVQNGFEDAISGCTAEIMTDMISGFGTQLALRQTEVYGIGYRMAEYFKLGMLDSFEINSPSKVAMRDVDYIAAGFQVGTDDNASVMEYAGYDLGKSYEKGMKDALENAGEDSVYDTAHTMSVKSDEYEDMAYSAGETLGTAFDKGVRDPTGSYCLNITGDEPAYDTAYTMDVKSKAYAYMAENGGNTLGNAFGQATASATGSWLDKISSTLRQFAKNPMGYSGGSLMGAAQEGKSAVGKWLDNVFGVSGVDGLIKGYKDQLEGLKDEYADEDPYSFESMVRRGALQYVTGVGYVYKRTGEIYGDLINGSKAAKNALDDETDALNENAGASGKSSKAKANSTKAAKDNTEAVKDNTESIEDNTDAQAEWEEQIREEAEQIEIVTERFKEYLKTFGKTDPMKNAKRLTKAFSTLWSTQDASLSAVTKTYKSASKTLSKNFKTINKQVLSFNDSGKYLGKFSKSLYKNTKQIEGRVTKTGKTIMKVMGPTTKVFYKVGDSVEKMTISTTKNLKKLGKQFAAARSFVSTFNDDIQGTGNSEDFILTLRSIEKFFGANKFKNMTDKVKNYLRGIVDEFAEFRNPMDILAKNIDGVGNVLSKNSRATAYVTDGFLALAASLYDGSEAANEYETEHARLLFLLENGLATEEEVAEHFQSYISRIKEALVEYRTSVQENLAGSMDIWSKFNQNLLEEGTDLIANIESQIAGYYNWGNMLMELSKRGLDSNILKLLTDEGVSSFGKAKALLEMTRSELALFTEDYEMSQAVIQHATDTAIAAMANAQTQASLRAAAAQGNKTAQAQLKQSQKNKKALMDDIKAVAQYRVKYNKLTAKEEKEYLKTLTEEERKYYKKQVKAAKKLKKEQTKLAKNERAKRAERDRLQGIRDSIKAFADYAEVLKKYQNDSKTLTYLLEEETKAFKDLTGVSSNISGNLTNANDALLAFADTLDATGEDGLTYFEEMAARVQRYTDEIKDAVKNTDYLKEAFDFTLTSSLSEYSKNAVSNLTADTFFANNIGKLSTMGFSRDALDFIVEEYKSDRAGALADMKAMLNATADEIQEMNAEFAVKVEQSKESAEKITAAVASTTSKDILETEVDNARKLYESNKTVYEEARKAYNKAVDDVATTEQAFNIAEKTLKDLEKAMKPLEKKEKKGTLTDKERKKLESLRKQYAKAEKQWEKAASEAGKAAQEVEDKFSNLTKAENALTQSETRLNKAQEELGKYLDENGDKIREARRKAELKQWFMESIKSVDALIKGLSTLNKATEEYAYLVGEFRDFESPFDSIIDTFNSDLNANEYFAGLREQVKKLNLPINTVSEGMLKFGLTLVDASEYGDDFMAMLQGMSQALNEYQSSLKDSISSSSDFFSEFKEAEEAVDPKKSIYNAQTQVDAMKKWSEAIKVLAARGLDPALLQHFAEQGLSSYNDVLAWAYTATDEDLGEYNSLWKEHQEALQKATEDSMEALAITYSTAGRNMQQAMIDAFNLNGNEKWVEALSDTAETVTKMIVTGVQDGVGNAMPQIAEVVEETGEIVSTTLATSLTSTDLTNAISTMSQTVSTETTATITNAANDAVEKFKMAVESINRMIEEDINHNPVITPVVDTTQFDAAIARMNEAISGIKASAATTGSAVESSIAAQNNAKATPLPTGGLATPPAINYVQNNYSPKALSRAEIYRQTRNQLGTIESVVISANGG